MILSASDDKYDSLSTLKSKMQNSSFAAALHFISMLLVITLLVPILINWYVGKEAFDNVTMTSWSYMLTASLVFLALGSVISRSVKKYGKVYYEILDFQYILSDEEKRALEKYGFILNTNSYPVIVLHRILIEIHDIQQVQCNFVEQYEKTCNFTNI